MDKPVSDQPAHPLRHCTRQIQPTFLRPATQLILQLPRIPHFHCQRPLVRLLEPLLLHPQPLVRARSPQRSRRLGRAQELLGPARLGLERVEELESLVVVVGEAAERGGEERASAGLAELGAGLGARLGLPGCEAG